jgi:hypothetical protein
VLDLALPLLYALPVAALALALGWQPWRAGGERPLGPWLGALALAGSFAVVYAAHERAVPALPPVLLKDLLLSGGALLILAAALERPGAGRAAVAHVVFAGLAGYALWVGLEIYRTRHWVDREPLVRLGALYAAWLLHHGLMRAALVRRPNDGFGAFALLLAISLAAGVLAQSYIGAALFAGSSAVVVGGAWVIGLWRRELPTLRGLAQPLAWFSGGALLIGPLFGATPWPAAALAALAFHVGWAGGATGWRGGVLRVLFTAALGGLALHLALPEPSSSPAPGGIDYSDY